MTKQQLNRLKQKMRPWFFLAPALIMLTVVIVLPICKVIQYSFVDNIFLSEDMSFVGISNYVDVLTDPRTGKMLLFTVGFTLGSVLLHTVIGIVFAVLLNGRISPKHWLSSA